MDEPSTVQAREDPRDLDAVADAIGGRQALAGAPELRECERHVVRRVDLATSHRIGGQLHHVVKKARRIVASDVEQRHLRAFAERDRGKFAQAAPLPLKRLRPGKPLASHQLDRAPYPRRPARQPHIAVAPAVDLSDEFIVGHDGPRGRGDEFLEGDRRWL